MIPDCAPWIHDTRPQNWVKVSFAAQYYFRRTVLTVKRQIKSGHLERRGIKSYWDGTIWWVRLPNAVTATHIKLYQPNRNCG
jgi:hypothetical protein